MSSRANRERTWRDFLTSEDIAPTLLLSDDRQAAQAHLDVCHPIYYCEDKYPNEMVREWPDGSLELVTVIYDGRISRTTAYRCKRGRLGMASAI